MNSGTKIAIEAAIEREREAYTLYTNMDKQTKLPNLKHLLTTLALQELKHERLLREALNNEDFEVAFKKISEADPSWSRIHIADEIESSESFADMDDALTFAIGLELEAYNTYMQLYKKAENEELKKLFSFLASEESSHRVLLQKERIKMMDS